MAPTFKLLWCIVTHTILHLTQQTASQCVVVYVNIDTIDSSLSALDWEGTYFYDGFSTQDSCLAYSTPNGQTLRYYHGSWSLSSPTKDLLSYETTDTGPPCDPPLGTLSWSHGSVVTSATISIRCSLTDTPTLEPTTEPTTQPTFIPTTSEPTKDPTADPTSNPTNIPTAIPTTEPTLMPSSIPTIDPTVEPTEDPTPAPTDDPTSTPSHAPVAPPTRAPTAHCSRISLVVLGPSWAIVTPPPITGVYYQQPNEWPPSGYPWYSQTFSGTESDPQPTNHASIYWEEGAWNIRYMNDLLLQYQENNVDPTARVPPHTEPFGDSWQDITTSDNVLWTILITCDSITGDPTSDPTNEPTTIPTTDPTIEPTVQPTIAEPTFLPTQEPIVTTEPDAIGGESLGSESFLDTFSILEWLIIASIPLIICLIFGSLYIWRTNKIESYQKEQEWHQPSAVQKDSVDELQMSQKRKKPKKLHFDQHVPQHSLQAVDNAHTPVNYKDKKLAADFSNALAIVATHKSNRSLPKQEYQEVLPHSLPPPPTMDDAEDKDVTTADVTEMVPLSVAKRDSEFYGDHPIDEIYSYTFVTKPFGMEWKTTKSDKKNLYVSKVVPKSQAHLGNVEIGSKLISFNGEMIEGLGAKKIYAKLAITDMPLTITFLKPFKKDEDKEGDNFVSPSAASAKKAGRPRPIESVVSETEEDHLMDDITVGDDGQGIPRGDTTPPDPSPPLGLPPSPAAPDLYAEKPLVPPKTPPIPHNYSDGGDQKEDPLDDPFAAIGPNPVEDSGTAFAKQPTETMMKQAQALIPAVFDDDPQESFHAD